MDVGVCRERTFTFAMEGSAPHSASHSRAAPPPPSSASAAAAAAFFKKVYTNGAAAGGNAFIAYGVTPFAPRAEHYSEIFESFLSGKSCSIPMLDLPPFDDSAAFDFVGCSGLVYSEIFGGFDIGDFALSHDQLFRRSDGSQESSESDAWTQAGTEYRSKESDPSACSGINQYVLNGDFHQTTDNKFNVSYHKVNMLSTEDLNVIHVAQLSAIPGNSDMSEGSSLQKEVEERYSSGIADDIISLEVSSGISAETQSKTASIPSHGSINENGRPHGINLNPTVMSVSDACLTTEPSHVPQASRPPPAAADRKKDPVSSMSTYEHPKSNAVKALFDVSSLDFLNVEFDTGSSGIASAESIKEAMDTAKVKLKSVRESMEGTKDASITKNDMNGTERVRTVFDESISRDDELQPKNECEYNLFKISCIGMQDVSEASQVLPDPFQAAKNTANRAAKPPGRKIIKNQPTSVVAEWEDNGSRLKYANHLEDKEKACTQKRIGGRKRTVCPRDEKQHSDMWLKKADEESRKSEDEMCEKEESETKPKEVQIINQCQKNVEEVTMSDCNEKKLIQSVEKEKFEKLEVATTNNRTEKKVDSAHDLTAKSLKLEGSANTDKIDDEVAEEEIENFQMYEDFAINEEQKMDKRDLHAELKSIQQHSYNQRLLTEKNNKVPEMTRKCEDLKSCSLRDRLDEKNIKPTAMNSECDEMVKNHECDEMLKNQAAEVMLVVEEKSDLRFGTLFGIMESKMAEMAHIYMSTKHLQKTITQPVMKERKSNHQKQSLSSNINQRVGQEVKAINGNLDPEDIQNAGKFRRKEEFEREHLRELELEREKERERDLEKERIRKLEEEREQEREKRMKLHLKRLEELRERERKKELNKDCLKKPKEERQGEREIKLEKERLGELDEELEREREREKDRMGVELKTSASHERACAEANEMAERTAVERETAEARQRAMAEARERLEKACAEAREKSLSEKASTEARLRAERFAVARAAAEARERVIEKAMAERDTFEARDQVARSASEKFSSPLRDLGLRHTSSSSDLWNSDKTDEAEGESAQRCRARLERHCRTVERVAKALAEKSTRDLFAQKEQAERNRLAESLDADIKRWSNGKEGNLHALLSTLQYILGPDSGWHPIPLTEILASAAVKKAYRKATLCVHPDKLQQRGATIQQKYICEKVFDLLKDSWNKFNSEER